MTNRSSGSYDPIAPAVRERLDRIANAERDRRAGRDAVAIATIGEPVEWPARVVVALAHLDPGEGAATRGLLEQGLDAWANEFNLGDLNPAVAESEVEAEVEILSQESPDDALDTPLESFELDRAFEEAETEVESMRSVNSVAEQVLADDPFELDAASVDVDPASPFATNEGIAYASPVASYYSEIIPEADVSEIEGDDSDIAYAVGFDEEPAHPLRISGERRILAKLEGWLVNLEARRVRLRQRVEGRAR